MGSRRFFAGIGILTVFVMAFVMVAMCGCGGKTPSISSISPSSGAVGTEVVITGSNFGASQGSSAVQIGAKDAAIESWSDSEIKAMVPSGLDAGKYDVTVTTTDGTSVGSQFEVTQKEGQADKNTPDEAIADYIRKAGGDPTGWTFSKDKVSSEDPNWAIYKGVSPLPPEQEPPNFYLLQKVDGEWTVLTDGTDFDVQQYGGPSDLAW